MASHATAPLLDLQTIAEYPSIKIDGMLYGLLPADALSVFAFHRLNNVIPPIGEILGKGAGLTEADSDRLDRLLTDLCAVILDAPADVRMKLSFLHRMSIYTTFVKLPHGASILHVGTLQLAENPTTSPLIGDASPPSSLTSTAARRTNGSRKSRSRLSEPALP